MPEDDPKEMVRFWRGWTGLYLFVLIFGVLQIGLLCLFTALLNKP
jgi:hypothetical protein